ncbi:hypothetical protein [Corynebacterium sp. HMSC072A02]|uniref:hypothetical protein n=1 Tax=Corynebacterium sp. HMSC072A02 TaxID=1715177 RepID=UPI0008A25CFA|nr:hypothetical protein [Corynebacterium sp. HMSC072A02]OFM28727.1 hypothetical protein HMPREF2698_04475 [Corynebacterium sp. HMSC072A02]
MTNVIIFGHGATADDIRSRLCDLRAVGLLQDFLWIDYAHPTSGAVVRSFTEEGTARLSTLDDALRSFRGDVLLATIDPMDAEQPQDVAKLTEWVGAVDQRLIQASNLRVRLLLSALPRESVDIAPLQGWSNLVLSPEEGGTPASSRIRPIKRTADGFELAQFAAPAVASIFGLWRGMPEPAVLDPETHRVIETGDRQRFRLVRAFHRTIDASDIEDKVRKAVFDPSQRLPQPQVNNISRAVHYANPEQLTDQCAQMFINQEISPLVSAPTAYEELQSHKVSGWAALKDNLRLYWSTVVGKPQDWVEGQRGAMNKNAATFLQKMLYGQDSSVEVVLAGHSGKGSGATSVDELRQASEHTMRVAREQHFSLGQEPQLSRTWEAYHDYALGLVDGSWRDSIDTKGLRNNQGNLHIVQYGGQSVQDVSASFEGFHPLMTSTLGYTHESQATVAPFDPVGAERFAADIEYTSQQTRNEAVSRKKHEFASWRAKNSTTFAWKVGQGLWEKLGHAQQKYRDAYAKARELEELANSFQARDYNAENKPLIRKLRTLWIVLFVVLALMTYMVAGRYNPDLPLGEYLQWFGWPWYVVGIILAVLLFLVCSWAVFTKAQRGIFDDEQRRKLLNRNQEIAAQNLATASAEISRISNAYNQFLSWSALLGRAIYAPFGRKETSSDHLRTPQSGLPENARIAQAVLNRDDAVRMTDEIRSHIFQTEWAHRSLKSLLDDMNDTFERNRTGHSAVALNEMWGMAGLGSSTALDNLSRSLDHPYMQDRDHKQQEWQKVITDPRMTRSLQQYLSRVTFREEGGSRVQSTAEFLDGMNQEKGALQAFSSNALTNAGGAEGYTEIDGSRTRIVEVDSQTALTSQLSRSVTVVQYGKITDFKYLIPDAASNAPSFVNPADLSLDDLDDMDHMGFKSPVQGDNQGPTTQPPFGRPEAPDLSDLDETF